MALPNPVKVTGPNPAVNAYTPTPTSQYTGVTPETEVGFIILGYLRSNSNIMLFQVNDNVNTSSSLSPNSSLLNTLNVSNSLSTNIQQQTDYYTVDFGQDTAKPAWTLTFNITLKNGSTGSWKFTKGKTDDDSITKY